MGSGTCPVAGAVTFARPRCPAAYVQRVCPGTAAYVRRVCLRRLPALPAGLAEGKEGEAGYLEVLQTEGDADDGDAEQGADNDVGKGNFYPAAEDPDDVQHEVNAAGLAVAEDGGFAEGAEREDADFHQLQAEGNADDGNAKQQSGNDISQPDEEAAEQEPKYVSES